MVTKCYLELSTFNPCVGAFSFQYLQPRRTRVLTKHRRTRDAHETHRAPHRSVDEMHRTWNARLLTLRRWKAQLRQKRTKALMKKGGHHTRNER